MPCYLYFWSLVLLWYLGWQGGEGCLPAMGGTGMDPMWTELFHVGSMKEHGQYPPVGYGPSKHDLRMNKPSVAKRSYKRALRRIASHGYCWYRGQCLNKADVSMDSLNQAISPCSPRKIGRMGPRWTGPLPPNRAHVPRHTSMEPRRPVQEQASGVFDLG